MGLLAVTLLLACSGGDDKDDSAAAGDDTDDTDGADPDVAPFVTAVTAAACGVSTDGYDVWTLEIKVADPQGVSDIASRGSTVSVMDGDTVLGSYELACFDDTCAGSWRATDDGIDCAIGGASVFRFVILDESGNTSDPYDYDPS